jgi:ABC-type uncharacterized transport system substrate-binding protein
MFRSFEHEQGFDMAFNALFHLRDTCRQRVLVAMGTPATLAAKKATSRIPIVALAGDLVGTGLVASLRHPGGNVTGVTLFLPEMNEKRLELLKEVFPQSSRVAVLFNPDNVSTFRAVQAMAIAAPSLNLGLQEFEAGGSLSSSITPNYVLLPLMFCSGQNNRGIAPNRLRYRT